MTTEAEFKAILDKFLGLMKQAVDSGAADYEGTRLEEITAVASVVTWSTVRALGLGPLMEKLETSQVVRNIAVGITEHITQMMVASYVIGRADGIHKAALAKQWVVGTDEEAK